MEKGAVRRAKARMSSYLIQLGPQDISFACLNTLHIIHCIHVSYLTIRFRKQVVFLPTVNEVFFHAMRLLILQYHLTSKSQVFSIHSSKVIGDVQVSLGAAFSAAVTWSGKDILYDLAKAQMSWMKSQIRRY